MADEHISPHDEDTLPDDRPELTPVSPLAETVADQSEPIPPTPVPSWPPAQRSFREPERFPRGTIILLAIIALILIGSGFGFILYATTVQYRTSLHQQATSVPQSTGQAQKTALAQNQATANAMATANGNIYATTTAQVGATATSTAQAANVTATAGTFGNIFTNATSGTPALDDPLSDNTGKHKWDVTNGIVGSGCIFTGGAYHAIEDKQGFYQPCFAQATNFSNFAYVVQMTIDSGKQDGIIFRANNTTGSFYLFRIGPDGSYALDVYRNHSFAVTLVSGISAAITTGLKQSNEIAVIANNTTLYLYANKQFIVSVDDNTLSTGQIGVVALDYTNPTVAEFTNAQVWKVTSASLSATPSPSVSPTATESPSISPTTSPTARPTATSTYTP